MYPKGEIAPRGGRRDCFLRETILPGCNGRLICQGSHGF